MTQSRRDRITPPAHMRPHIAYYAMKDWFSKEKSCPGRERLLWGVGAAYNDLMTMSGGDGENPSLEFADSAALAAVAQILGQAINMEQSLVDWIEEHDQTYPAEIDKWYAICCAAGWVVIQTYFRECIVRSGGE